MPGRLCVFGNQLCTCPDDDTISSACGRTARLRSRVNDRAQSNGYPRYQVLESPIDLRDNDSNVRQVFFRLAIGPIGMIVASEPDLPWNRYGRSHGTSGAQPRCRDHGGGTGGWLANTVKSRKSVSIRSGYQPALIWFDGVEVILGNSLTETEPTVCSGIFGNQEGCTVIRSNAWSLLNSDLKPKRQSGPELLSNI